MNIAVLLSGGVDSSVAVHFFLIIFEFLTYLCPKENF